MTEDDKNDCQNALDNMRNTKEMFYLMAQKCDDHQFIEFTGFINEYINASARELSEGKDFRNCTVKIEHFEAMYMAEKLKCIFGSQLELTFKGDK